LCRDTLERTARSSQRVLGPVVGTERSAPGTLLEGTGRAAGSPKPTVAKFVFWRRLPHLFGVRREWFVRFSFVELFPVHVTVGSEIASLYWAIHSKGEMPRVVKVLGVHGCKSVVARTKSNQYCNYKPLTLHSLASFQILDRGLLFLYQKNSTARDICLPELSSGRWIAHSVKVSFFFSGWRYNSNQSNPSLINRATAELSKGEIRCDAMRSFR